MNRKRKDRARQLLTDAGYAVHSFLTVNDGWYLHIMPGWQRFDSVAQVHTFLREQRKAGGV